MLFTETSGMKGELLNRRSTIFRFISIRMPRRFSVLNFRKRIFLLFIPVFSSFGVLPFPAACEEPADKGLAVLKFGAGIATAMLIHEGSHALVAGITGTHMTWKLGSYNQPLGFTEQADSDAKGVAVYMSGLISQEIASEIFLDTKIDKNNAYVRGMMAWNIINPVLYSLDYWVFHIANSKDGNSYRGDISGIEHYSNAATANGYALGITAIALFQGYRFLKTQSWAPDWLRSEKKQMFVAPLASGGFVASYNIKF